MTQTEINKLLGQINKAFQDQTDRLEQLQVRLETLESKVNEQEKRPKVSKGGGKRVQQTKANPEPPYKEIRRGS
tara:strand:- start:452 stop:673 length:222 start_codon:yes stop_codon:yes gene_type:complete